MKITQFSEIIVDEQDIVQGLYSGKITDLSTLNIEDSQLVTQFNQARQENADRIPPLTVFSSNVSTQIEFDAENQKQWFMPKEYQNFDIEAYLLEQCKTNIEVDRVAEELELFYQHKMIDVLKYLKYLVDTMRTNNIVWGIGRGSSVASYCLYILGIHKVDSIRFELDIHEFLK